MKPAVAITALAIGVAFCCWSWATRPAARRLANTTAPVDESDATNGVDADSDTRIEAGPERLVETKAPPKNPEKRLSGFERALKKLEAVSTGRKLTAQEVTFAAGQLDHMAELRRKQIIEKLDALENAETEEERIRLHEFIVNLQQSEFIHSTAANLLRNGLYYHVSSEKGVPHGIEGHGDFVRMRVGWDNAVGKAVVPVDWAKFDEAQSMARLLRKLSHQGKRLAADKWNALPAAERRRQYEKHTKALENYQRIMRDKTLPFPERARLARKHSNNFAYSGFVVDPTTLQARVR